jgi:hypothetical protein
MSPACLGEFRAARVPHSPPGGSSGAKVRGSGLRAQAEEEPLSRVSTSVSFPRGAGHEEGRQRARLQAMGWVPPAVGAAVVAGERQAGRSPPEGEGRSKRDGTGRDGTEREGGQTREWLLVFVGGRRERRRESAAATAAGSTGRRPVPLASHPPAPWPWLTALLFRSSVCRCSPSRARGRWRRERKRMGSTKRHR